MSLRLLFQRLKVEFYFREKIIKQNFHKYRKRETTQMFFFRFFFKSALL
jgi:hypothetical protein